MAWIRRFLPQALLHLLSAKDSNGEKVGSGDVTDNGGAIAGSADVLMMDTGNEVCSSGPIHITEPGDKNKLEPDTGEAAEASEAQKATEEVPNTNQEQSESLGKLPEGLPLTSQKRRKRRASTRAPGSDIPQETKKTRRARGPKWTSEETEMLKTCKSQPSLPKGKQGWEAIAAQISTRDAIQCRQRWDTLQKIARKTLTTTISPGPAENELNGASTSTLPVGKPNVPSSACPNLEVSHPAPLSVVELMPAAIPVEQGPAAGELTGWRQYEEAGIFTDNYLVLLKTKRQQRCEEAKPMLFNLWWLLLHPFPLHRELKQKVTQQQQQPGLIDRFHTWSSRRLSFLKALKDSLPNLDAKWLAALARFLLPHLEHPFVPQDRLPTSTTAEGSHPAMAVEHLHDCDDLIGDWLRDFPSPDDTPQA